MLPGRCVDTKVCCRNDFRMSADTFLKPGAGHDLIIVYSMDWLVEGNEILSVKSRYLVSALQHGYIADSYKFPPKRGSLSKVSVKPCSACRSISAPII